MFEMSLREGDDRRLPRPIYRNERIRCLGGSDCGNEQRENPKEARKRLHAVDVSRRGPLETNSLTMIAITEINRGRQKQEMAAVIARGHFQARNVYASTAATQRRFV